MSSSRRAMETLQFWQMVLMKVEGHAGTVVMTWLAACLKTSQEVVDVCDNLVTAPGRNG